MYGCLAIIKRMMQCFSTSSGGADEAPAHSSESRRKKKSAMTFFQMEKPQYIETQKAARSLAGEFFQMKLSDTRIGRLVEVFGLLTAG
ncbi:hypothetical protein EV182_006504 [Spiromyces aspiralis]|uniref:Uncharacterized protein n=1 Tax=Spiromyces aspiralis TaxID=68401 RepID=A0ACC1HTP0_9FUNG|nr:hypothetical protein EV182_006504 [Spiromyces aspiralis]